MKFYAVNEYQPQVNDIYSELATDLKKNLSWASIEHIGSSAVPGAISKADLDILVRVSTDTFDRTLTNLQKLGFKIKLDTHRDHQLCMLTKKHKSIDVATQVIEIGSKYEFFTIFRDALITDTTLLRSYNDLKIQCAGLSEEEYRKHKSEFIAQVLDQR